jgi:hypothetical protein
VIHSPGIALCPLAFNASHGRRRGHRPVVGTKRLFIVTFLPLIDAVGKLWTFWIYAVQALGSAARPGGVMTWHDSALDSFGRFAPCAVA